MISKKYIIPCLVMSPVRECQWELVDAIADRFGLTCTQRQWYSDHRHVVTLRIDVQRDIGIRRLRDGLTRYLGQVRRGERLVITHRGQPVAVLLPYRRGRARSGIERLGALLVSGHVSPAERPFLKRPPLARGRGRRPSELIAEDRR